MNMYEYRCLICDWMWVSDDRTESCSKCGESDDLYIEDLSEDFT